ncbi:glycoside hydrolase family 3 N-terminal domain-containing protein [Namhaeicola litoreus]|uniref:beta-glucosidase n=1 Tax=Namhaeicola litoreus TaxID=1052145 RepID=A0ABW3Y1H5_9FLAO
MNIKKLNLLLVLFGFFQLSVVYSQNNFEREIEALLAKLSLEEKIGQTSLRGTSSRVKGALPESLKQAVREGRVGAMLNVMRPEFIDELQKIAIEESPHNIPLLFSRDVIHGFKTIFPIPLGLAASWDAEIVEQSARIAAIEASSIGIRWTFAPMLDIAQDTRWGRIAESPGEDPYLASILAEAYVKGFQGTDLSDPSSLAVSLKHFIGYGAAIGGRDYNTAIIDNATLQNLYIPPFEAGIKAGAQTVMTSFNELNGVPASGNKFILKNILRDQLKFDGLVVSDWNSVTEMINHGYAEDQKHAAELGVNAGLDMEMTSTSYEDHIKNLLEEQKISESQLDDLVRNILRVKFRLGLFDDPYNNISKRNNFYSPEHLDEAEKAAIKSSVLLKNNGLLPLKKETKIALIGPLSNKGREQLGTWTFDGEGERSVTPLQEFRSQKVNVDFQETLKFSRDKSELDFKKAIEAAKKSDVILFIGGEEAILSGEAHSRAEINLPGAQEKLIKELKETGKPLILVIMAGRPITIEKIISHVDAVLMVWHPGTMGGPALYKMIFGVAEPGGRLPVTWPKTSGQLPLFYNHKNTGRPADAKSFVGMDSIPVGAWQSSLGNQSHYLDAGFSPRFPFGFGLGYTYFTYDSLKVSSEQLTRENEIEVVVSVKNMGERDGEEVVQLYIQDITGSITRPVKELKGFKRVFLPKGKEVEVKFNIRAKDLEFVNNEGIRRSENGKFNLWIGKNSAEGLQASFELID